MKASLFLALAALAIAATPAYKVTTTVKIGGEGRWDDIYVDGANHRLYVSHNSQVEVIDTVTDQLVGTIFNTPAVHGIAIANDLGKGFITTGSPANKVIIFDLATLQAIGSVATGQNPDAISYDPVTHRIVALNDRSGDATIIDAKTGEVITLSLPLGGKPAFSQPDGKGHVYANIENKEDKQEIVEISMKESAVSKHYSTAPCDDSSGPCRVPAACHPSLPGQPIEQSGFAAVRRAHEGNQTGLPRRFELDQMAGSCHTSPI